MSEPLELWITAELSEKIREHGVETYPYECCGALLGTDHDFLAYDPNQESRKISRGALSLFPLVNRRDDSPRNRFSVTADDVREAEKAATSQGLEVIGWYHSHPDHPARPSDYDRDHAWPWYSYIIVSVHTGMPRDMTSWRLKDDRSGFLPEKISLMKGSAAD
ncbi:MAG TPA: M67 family metallopeptidase [Candidatus Acidoferrum sp.]|nr:M67 family metallopeptidase [Candidatus Acidoferrum sp.]